MHSLFESAPNLLQKYGVQSVECTFILGINRYYKSTHLYTFRVSVFFWASCAQYSSRNHNATHMICFKNDSWWLTSSKALVFWTISLMAMSTGCITSMTLAEQSSYTEQRQYLYYICFSMLPCFLISLWGFCETYIRIYCC